MDLAPGPASSLARHSPWLITVRPEAGPSSSADTRPEGQPRPPKPPTRTVAPSNRPANASRGDGYTLPTGNLGPGPVVA